MSNQRPRPSAPRGSQRSTTPTRGPQRQRHQPRPQRGSLEWAYRAVMAMGASAFPSYITADELSRAFSRSRIFDVGLDRQYYAAVEERAEEDRIALLEARKHDTRLDVFCKEQEQAEAKAGKRNKDFSFTPGDSLCDVVRENVLVWAEYFHENPQLAR